MITSFMSAAACHAIQFIHQKGTKLRARGLCSVEDDASVVYQVPEWAFDGRQKFGEMPVCAKCAGIVNAMKKAPPP